MLWYSRKKVKWVVLRKRYAWRVNVGTNDYPFEKEYNDRSGELGKTHWRSPNSP